MRRVLFLLSAVLLGLQIAAQEQGAVSGLVVSSWDGSTLPGVIVTVRGTTLAAQTDQNGRYQINNVPAGDHVLRFSKPGFASAVVGDVRVLPGQTTSVNGNLRPEFYEMEEYEVTAEEFTEQTEKIIFERQQATSMLEAIGSEQFSKLGASDAGAIVSRVTGVSLVGGKYAVVRGLSDRYTRTLMNGLEVPSSDPYRTAPQLDLFPAAMIDRINVTKTFTPDQPGGTGGGTIDILTKPFPDKAFVKASFGLSYNPNSNLRDDFLADPKGSLGFLKFPDSPEALQEDLWQLGNSPAPNPPGPASSSETQARAESRRAQANQVRSILRALGTTDFAGAQKSSPLNSNMSASAGDTLRVFDRSLGLFGSMNYSRNFRLIDEAPVSRFNGLGTETRGGKETRGNIMTDTGANVNMGYELSDNNELGFNFMFAESIDEEARRVEWNRFETPQPPGYRQDQWQLHHTARQVQNFQLRGLHDFPSLADSKLSWNTSLANTTQDEPDHRFMNYTIDESGGISLGVQDIVPFFPSRYFRKIDDQSVNVRADWSTPLPFFKQDSNIKVGILNSATERDFREQYFTYEGIEGFVAGDPNSYLNDPRYLEYIATSLGGRRTNYNFARYVRSANGNPYQASQSVTAGYPMLDLGVLSWLRLVGGVRVEATSMRIDATGVGSSELEQVDLLPSAGVVFTVITNLNLRLSYTETVARPSFREKAPISNYLPDLDLFADGNPQLGMSSITSYDARLEWFPGPGDIASAGVFYKDLTQPIELYRTDLDKGVTWVNRDKGKVMGVEFEARKAMDFISERFKGLTLGANVAIIQSETKFTSTEIINKNNARFQAGDTRPLYDQSPYIINIDASYEHPTWGTTLTLAANMTGERIILTTAQGPEIYEHPPITFDALISQKIGKHLSVRFGVRNLLDPMYRQTHGESFDDPIRIEYRRGRAFSISLTSDF